jgi:hypothetical protein
MIPFQVGPQEIDLHGSPLNVLVGAGNKERKECEAAKFIASNYFLKLK